MNKKRNNFELPTFHEIKITPYWLLGFIEGQGSTKIEVFDEQGQLVNTFESIKSCSIFLM